MYEKRNPLLNKRAQNKLVDCNLFPAYEGNTIVPSNRCIHNKLAIKRKEAFPFKDGDFRIMCRHKLFRTIANIDKANKLIAIAVTYIFLT